MHGNVHTACELAPRTAPSPSAPKRAGSRTIRELSAGIERHLAETKTQRERLKACLERRGTSSSGMKDMAGKFTAMMQGLSGTVASDEVAKGAMASSTFEHYEIAAYRMVVAAAQLAGDAETARVCEGICREEEAMAAQLGELLPRIATTYLERSAKDMAEAKR